MARTVGKTNVGIRDLVVFLDRSAASDVRLDIALDIAGRYNAFLVGAYVATELILGRHSDEFARGAGVAAVAGREAAAEDDDAARAGSHFANKAAEKGIAVEWRPISKFGTAADVVLQARYADLSIVGQTTDDGMNALWTPEDLLFAFGGPTLIVPHTIPRDYRVGGNILIAWDASREAKRAVADAMPFLVSAGTVTVIVVDPPRMTGRSDEAGVALVRHLDRHGVKATVSVVASSGRSVGQAIIDQAEALSADLIVMGAYGHMRMIEMVFGGATRTLLAHTPVPVLMSH